MSALHISAFQTGVRDVVEPLVKFVELGLLRVVPFFDRRHRAALPEDAELGLPHDFGIAMPVSGTWISTCRCVGCGPSAAAVT